MQATFDAGVPGNCLNETGVFVSIVAWGSACDLITWVTPLPTVWSLLPRGPSRVVAIGIVCCTYHNCLLNKVRWFFLLQHHGLEQGLRGIRYCHNDCLRTNAPATVRSPHAQEIRDAARNKLKDIQKNKSALRHQSLLEAVEGGCVQRVEEELSRLQMTELRDGRSHTPLHPAVQYRRANVLEKLLEQGFSALARTKNDETPVYLALELTVESKNRILKFDRKLSESEDETSESKEKLDSIFYLDERTSKLLIKSCDISKLRDEIYQLQRWTLLHLAAAANSVYIVKYILRGILIGGTLLRARNIHSYTLQQEWEAVVEQKSSDKATPLFAASKRCQAGAVRFLLGKGANINILASDIKVRVDESRCDVTALHIAAPGGHTEAVKILCDDKRNRLIKAKTNRGETALHPAVQNSHQSCQGVIDALGEIINIEERAIFRVNGKTKKRTALHMAVENGNVKGTLELLELGAKPNVETEELKLATRTARSHAAARGH